MKRATSNSRLKISNLKFEICNPFRLPPTAYRLPPAACRLRRGLTLLEVILALAILAGSIAVLGELVRAGLRSAGEARDFTRAELYAESIISQVVAGSLPTGSVSNAPVDDDPNYLYSMVTGQVDQSGLLEVRVTVARNLPPQKRPVEFTLVRWLVDPQMEANLAEQALATAQSQSQSQQSTSQSSGTSSNSGGQ